MPFFQLSETCFFCKIFLLDSLDHKPPNLPPICFDWWLLTLLFPLHSGWWLLSLWSAQKIHNLWPPLHSYQHPHPLIQAIQIIRLILDPRSSRSSSIFRCWTHTTGLLKGVTSSSSSFFLSTPLEWMLHNPKNVLFCPLVGTCANDARSLALSPYQRTIHTLLKGPWKCSHLTPNSIEDTLRSTSFKGLKRVF